MPKKTGETARTQGIYQIINSVTGECYVGCSYFLEQRWIGHRANLRRNRHHSQKMQEAWNRDGERAFRIEIIEIVGEYDDLYKREWHYIQTMQPAYNGKAGREHPLSERGIPATFLLTTEIEARLIAYANNHGQSRSAVIRELIAGLTLD